MSDNPYNYEPGFPIENHRDELIDRLGRALREIADLKAQVSSYCEQLQDFKAEQLFDLRQLEWDKNEGDTPFHSANAAVDRHNREIVSAYKKGFVRARREALEELRKKVITHPNTFMHCDEIVRLIDGMRDVVADGIGVRGASNESFEKAFEQAELLGERKTIPKFIRKTVPEETISDECKWCGEGEPEWSDDAQCWIHRRPRLDKRCLRKRLAPMGEFPAKDKA